ncbi:metal-dependent phosphohydrolase [Micromonospora sp. NPDC049679]|uniref:HD domain-containing protein n=1 Tax=Micromonospora sp. NPDC049679 TaxID=3155920 RepID=UPI0033E02F15
MLIDRWRSAVRGAGATGDEETVTGAGIELIERWREPQRHHHDVTHLDAVLSVVDGHADFAAEPDLVRLAAWWHDAVYDPRADGDRNERESAALAGRVLAGLGLAPAAVAEVDRLVLLTAGHAVDPGDRDGALLCDADLGVLAGAPDAYDRYAAAVRREYAHVPAGAFRDGRAAVLRRLLRLPALYRVPALAARWEGPARANLARELAALAAEEG